MPAFELTEELAEGKEAVFQAFMLRCLRATIIQLRDTPRKLVIPDHFEPDKYHLVELKKARRELNRVKNWSAEKAEVEARRYYKVALRDYQSDVQDAERVRQAYLDMIEKVESWMPPPMKSCKTFKENTLRMLREAMDRDCQNYTAPREISGQSYRCKLINDAKWSILYHQREYKKEVQVISHLNKHVRALVKSFGN